MYLLAEQRATIDCTASSAYAYATDLEHFADWFPGVLAIHAADGQPAGSIGKTYLERVRIPLRGEREIRVTVVDAERDRRFATESPFRPLLPRMEMQFDADGEHRCQLRWRMFSRNRSAVARMTVLPLARAVLRRRAAQGIAALKQQLESGRSGR